MNIPERKRPFARKYIRLTRSGLYRTRLWSKVLRPEFLAGSTLYNGEQVPNTLCIECYKQGRSIPTFAVDHIIAIQDGGSPTDIANMQGLCEHHHAIKSAQEGNARRKTKRIKS